MNKLLAVLLGCLVSAVSIPQTTVTKLTHITINPLPASSCTATSSGLVLRASPVRITGISPLLVFFDATGTTDSAITGSSTAFQDVTVTWDFGDGGTSGTANWLYGSNPNGNSRDTATGAVAAHEYIVPDGAGDTSYTINVTANDGTNTASCALTITAYDPSGSNGFPGTNTICYFNSSVGSCPSGAVQTSSSIAHVPAAGKRILYKCGDTFTGASNVPAIAKWSIGVYGGCEGTQSSRPIMTGTVSIDTQASDGRVSDLDLETGPSAAVLISNAYDPPYTATTQITLNNLLSNATNRNFYVAQATQMGYIQLVANHMGTQQGTFVNFAENNCTNGSSALNCGGTPAYVNSMYTAMLGGSYNGAGAPSGSGIETVRVSACRMCVFENNTITNANNVGAVFKFHSGNTKNSSGTWIGQYNEYIEDSDNDFTGTSGAQLVEYTPQNSSYDERTRNVVIERDHYRGVSTGGGRQIWISAQNLTMRDNVCDGVGTCALYETRTTGTAATNYPNKFLKFFNNTCRNGGTCADLNTTAFGGPAPINSIAQNNLCYNNGSCVTGGGTNTISNNTSNVALNPAFTNGSGLFSLISDFKPTANYTGGTAVPIVYDALGIAWAGTPDLGAVKH